MNMGSELRRCNVQEGELLSMLLLGGFIKKLRAIIENRYTYSGSCRAAEILADFEKSTNYFRKIAPFR